MDSGEDNPLGTALKKSDKSNITDSSPQKRRSEGSEVLSDGKKSRRLEETSHTLPVKDVKQEEPDDVEPVSDEPKDSEEPTDSRRMRSEGSNTPEKDSASQGRVSKPYSEHTTVPIVQSLFGNEPQSSTSAQDPETSHTVPVEDPEQEEPDDVEPVSDKPAEDSEEPTDSRTMRSEGSNTPEKDSASQGRVSKPYSEHDKVPIVQSLFGNEPQSSTLVQDPETTHTLPQRSRRSEETSGQAAEDSHAVEDPEQEEPDEPEADESFQAPSPRGSNDPKKCSAKSQERLSKPDDTGTSEGSQPSTSAQRANRPAEDSEAGPSQPSGHHNENFNARVLRENEERKQILRELMESLLDDFDNCEELKDPKFVELLIGVIRGKQRQDRELEILKNLDKNPEEALKMTSEENKEAWVSNRAEDMEKIKRNSWMRGLRRKGRSYFVGSPEENLKLTNFDYHSFHDKNKKYVRKIMEDFLKYPRHRGPNNRIFMFHLANMFESHENKVPIWRRMEVSDDEDEDEDEEEYEEEEEEKSSQPSTSGATFKAPFSKGSYTPGSPAPPSPLRLTQADIAAALASFSSPGPIAPERRPSRRSAPESLARKRTVFTDHQRSVLTKAIESGKAGPSYRKKLAKDVGLSHEIVTTFISNEKRKLRLLLKKKAEEEDEEGFDDYGPSTSTARPPRRSAPVVSLSLPPHKKIKSGNPSADDRKKLCEDLELSPLAVKNFISKQRRKKKEEEDESD